MIDTCEIRVTVRRSGDSRKSNPAFGTHGGFSWLRFWLRFGSSFGDDQEDVAVADDHNGRQEMLHDFNADCINRSHSIIFSSNCLSSSFKARALGSSPSRLTILYCRQNLQNDFQALPDRLVVLRTGFKNLTPD